VPLGAGGLQPGCLPSGLDAVLEKPAAFGLRRMAAQPVVGAGELPGGVEIARIGREIRRPDRRGPARARQVRAIGVK
jgi:hypothetical protein